MANQLKHGISLCDVKFALQLEIIKPLHAKLTVDLYTRMQGARKNNGFKSAGITETIQSVRLVAQNSCRLF